eukprot:ANDGO_00492.mRNA.1 Ribosome biogenesis protein WDR12 homolog
MEVQVRFVSSVVRLPYDDNQVFTLSDSLDPNSLNEVVKNVLSEDESSAASVPSLDFLINGIFLTTSLKDHLAKHGLSYESQIDIECVLGQPVPKKKGEFPHPDWVSAVGMLPCSSHFVTGSYDGFLRFWNAASSTAKSSALELAVHDLPIKSLVAASSSSILTASKDKTIRLSEVDVASRTASTSALFIGHEDSVETLALSADKLRFVSGSWDKTVKLWEIPAKSESEKESTRSQKKSRHDKNVLHESVLSYNILSGHADCVSSVCWPESSLIFSGSADRTIRVWDAVSGDCEAVWNCGVAVHSISFSSKARLLVSVHADRYARIWDARIRQGNVCKVAVGPHKERAGSVDWLADSDCSFVSGSFDGRVRFWDFRSRSAPIHTVHAHADKTLCVNSPAIGCVLSGGADGQLKVYRQLASSLTESKVEG